jgi:hypothetical protein
VKSSSTLPERNISTGRGKRRLHTYADMIIVQRKNIKDMASVARETLEGYKRIVTKSLLHTYLPRAPRLLVRQMTMPLFQTSLATERLAVIKKTKTKDRPTKEVG